MRFTPHSLKRSNINCATFLAISIFSFPGPILGSVEKGRGSLVKLLRSPLMSRRFFGLHLLGLVVLLQLLPVFLDEPGVRSDLVPLGWGDVTHDVFLLEYV